MPTIQIDRPIASWASVIDSKYRYIFIKGGRSSGKSHEVAGYLAERSYTEQNLKIACLREVQNSIKYSSKALIETKLKDFGVFEYYKSIEKEVKKLTDDGLFLFQGMSDMTADNAKSLEGFDIAWFEEAQNCSQKSIDTLYPTIRGENSQLVFTWNPDQPEDPIEKFCNGLKDDPDCLVITVNYPQNPFLSETIKADIKRAKERSPDDFDHIWLGGYNLRSDIRVFQNWRTQECAPSHNTELYYGADWGFAIDPTVLLRCWADDWKKEIYIDYQVDGVGIETDKLPELFDQIPDSRKYIIKGDSARPETISYLNRHGFKIKGCEKGKGSVESGIDWLRGYTIVCHPRCKLLEKELRLCSYKIDRQGNILPKVEDSNNHCIDALRYALEKLIKQKSVGGFAVL